VFNEGVGGTVTSNILAKLEKNLDKYTPDMVITMMGINDKGQYIPREGKDKGQYIPREGKLRLFFKDFRVYKLFKRIGQGLKYNFAKDKNAREEINPVLVDEKEEENILERIYGTNTIEGHLLVDLFNSYDIYDDYEELINLTEINLTETLAEPSSRNYNLFFFSFSLQGLAFIKLEMYEEAEERFKKSIEVNSEYPAPYLKLGDVYSSLNRTEDAIAMYEKYIIKNIGIGNEHAAIQLAKLYLDVNEYKNAYEVSKMVIIYEIERIDEIFIMGKVHEELDKTDDALNFFEAVLEKNSKNYAAYTELGWYYISNNMFKEEEELYNRLIEINPYTIIVAYGVMATRYQEENQFEKAEEMFDKALELRRKYYNPTTQQNYQELYEMVDERGIKLVVMQYPTLDIDELKGNFIGNEEIIFVSNEENFKKALETLPYEKLFIDNFAQSFGHATKRGNIMIAESAAQVILQEVN
jgi:tetratricopeptide (TPR) repeat protein